jgi:hypothetical protein
LASAVIKSSKHSASAPGVERQRDFIFATWTSIYLAETPDHFLAGGAIAGGGPRFHMRSMQKRRRAEPKNTSCERDPRVLFLATQRHVARQFALLSRSISRMSMRQLPSSINNCFSEPGDRYQQSRKKEHWMHRDTETDCERDHQSRPRWFENCDQHFFHNASFSRLKHVRRAIS